MEETGIELKVSSISFWLLYIFKYFGFLLDTD